MILGPAVLTGSSSLSRWAYTFSLGGDAVGRNASTGTEARGALMAVDDM